MKSAMEDKFVQVSGQHTVSVNILSICSTHAIVLKTHKAFTQTQNIFNKRISVKINVKGSSWSMYFLSCQYVGVSGCFVFESPIME